MLFFWERVVLTIGLLAINAPLIRYRHLLFKIERGEQGGGVRMAARVWGISPIQWGQDRSPISGQDPPPSPRKQGMVECRRRSGEPF